MLDTPKIPCYYCNMKICYINEFHIAFCPTTPEYAEHVSEICDQLEYALVYENQMEMLALHSGGVTDDY